MTLALGWLEPEHFPTWRRRLKLEYLAYNLTHVRREALLQLLLFVGDGGLFPSDDTVAAAARCCARTVRRARADARALGLLTWEHTRKLVDGRWRQGPNHYAVQVPTRPVCPGGQRVRRGSKELSKRPTGTPAAAFVDLPSSPEAARAALARIRQAREPTLVAAWQARRGGARSSPAPA